MTLAASQITMATVIGTYHFLLCMDSAMEPFPIVSYSLLCLPAQGGLECHVYIAS